LIRTVTAGVAAVAALACVSVPRAPRGYSFPDSFAVTQVVTVDPGRPGSREFLASLRRVDDDFEVTLFDGALEVPLMTASVRSGSVDVQVMTTGMDSGYGHRLIALLRDLYRREFQAPIEGRTDNDTGTYAARLAGLPDSSSPCRFPSTIEVIPFRNNEPGFLVRTVDVVCTASRRGP
jgi:hypothetical protein